MKRRICIYSFIVLFGLLLFASCDDRGPETISDYDVVYTNYDNKEDFSKVKTYHMPDSVVFILSKDDYGVVNHNYDQTLLESVKSNLDALGWTEVPYEDLGTVEPDVFVTVSAITATWVQQYWYDDWWDYWDWYPFYPDWGWGPGYYPWFGYPVYYTTYDTGTVFIEMTDPSKTDQNKKQIPVIWVGAINGLLEGSQVNQRIQKNVDQAFYQSPYLKGDIN
ncbi:DUF4136 domain-containing protein [Halosquirtibacter laminarini]|uniref:DUF4136 domain-containing protein n=1 Tax=Halosquirtibacter laminarini TaxID=3374600 RepID=A0AC61NBN0_9BACT|nr:DUF4136 domain-containing protein [Prolixibacteraceae bacterium]